MRAGTSIHLFGIVQLQMLSSKDMAESNEQAKVVLQLSLPSQQRPLIP